MCASRTSCILFGLLSSIGTLTMADEVERPHVRVEYDGIEEAYAQAMAKVLDAAWTVYAEEFAFDMPQRVLLHVTCDSESDTSLWTDGQDRINLTLKDADRLAKPSSSGTFHIYGLCHELGHVAMYRTLKNRPWLAGDAAEGWAHCAGSHVVDRVYKACGGDLWPDKYDYREDGTKRLTRQLAAKKPGAVTASAGQWQALMKLVGEKGLKKVFSAWNKSGSEDEVAASKKALRAALVRAGPKDRREDLEKWFDEFAKAGIIEIKASKQKSQTIAANRLSGRTTTLKHDDNGSDGRQSIAGSGHIVQFTAPAGEWYVTAVWIYGSRYGHPQAPDESVPITLCDSEIKPITTWTRPYADFERAEPKWHRLKVKPARVPERFAVCFNFNPTQTKGFFVHKDTSGSGHSLSGLPGRTGRPLEGAEWMIRVELDRPKSADSLGGAGSSSDKK